MPTVYVFGAGASRDAEYPLASDMGCALLEYMSRSENIWIRSSGEFLINTFGNLTNIEDLITQIQSRIEELKNAHTPNDRAQRMRMGNSRGFLGVALKEWFRELQSNPAPSYAIFADRIVEPGDMVITFNYAVSLERELRRAGKWDLSHGYGFPLGFTDFRSDVFVLKLHGSINWLVSLFGGALGGAFLVNPDSSTGNHPVIYQADIEFLGYEAFSGHTYRSGGAFPCLILPARSKEFFYDTSFGYKFSNFWDHLWEQAAQALEVADKSVICGYSLPQADGRARELLFQQPEREAQVEIVSGNQSDRIGCEFKNAGFGNVSTFKDGYFADWCQANQ